MKCFRINFDFFVLIILLIKIRIIYQINIGEFTIDDISELYNGEGGKKKEYKPTSEYFQICVFSDQKLPDLEYTPQVNISKQCYNKVLSKKSGATDIIIYKFFRLRNSTELEPGNLKAGITDLYEVYYQFIYYIGNDIDESTNIDIESTCNENILVYYKPTITSTLEKRYLNVYNQNPKSDPDIEDLQDYDIFNPNSDFFNSVCAIYTYNTYLEDFILKNTRLKYYDVSLEMRKKYYFPGAVEICPVTCDYVVMLNKKEGLIALCKCDDQHYDLLSGTIPTQIQTFSSVYYNEDKFINSDKDSYFSIEVFKCFKITMMYGFNDNYGSYMVLGIGIIISLAFGAIFLWGKGRIMSIFELIFNNNINNINHLRDINENVYSKIFENNSIPDNKNDNNIDSKNQEQLNKNKNDNIEEKKEEEKNHEDNGENEENEENENFNEGEEEEEDIELASPPKKIVKKKIKVKKKKTINDNNQQNPNEEQYGNDIQKKRYQNQENNNGKEGSFTQDSRKNFSNAKIILDKKKGEEQGKKNKLSKPEKSQDIPMNARKIKMKKGSKVDASETEETTDEMNYIPDIGSSNIVIPIDNIFTDQELNTMDLNWIEHYDRRSFIDVYFSILNTKCPIFFIFSYYNSNKGITLALQIKYPAIKLIFFCITIYICFFFNATVFGSKSITYRITNQYDFAKKVVFGSVLAPFCLMVQDSIYFLIFYEITKKIIEIKMKLFTSLFFNNEEEAKNGNLNTILKEEYGDSNKNYKDNNNQFNDEDITKKDIKEERLKLKNQILETFEFIKKRVFISIGCLTFVILFMWYYIAAFGSCYRNTQFAFLLNILITFVFCNIYPCFYSFIPAIFRKLALGKQDTKLFTCYKILNII